MSGRILLAAAVLAASVSAAGQALRLEVDTEEIYAGLPFVLSVSASGFQEEPAPDPPQLAIDGARVTYLGMTPNVSQQIQIVNGRRSEWKEVTFVYRWRVQPERSGRYTVPALTVVQGVLSAVSQVAAFDAGEVERAGDMFVRMRFPERPVWVGETFEVVVEWLIARDVESYEFVVPLFDVEHLRFEPPAREGRTVAFPAGAAEVALPMLRDTVVEDGVSYTRLRFPARVSVGRPGTLDLEPVRVAARLKSGTYRDAFGFRRSRTALFQAQGERARLVVRGLPEAGRPAGFVNAIGTGFSIAVAASRSVVQVGDPIELSVVVTGDGDLEGLSLPALDAEGGLSPVLFSVPDTRPFGVVNEQENAKTFEVTVRVRSAEASEIPPIALVYFDPVAGSYATTHSRPVALSVGTSDVIGAADVTVGSRAPGDVGVGPTAVGAPAVTNNAIASLIGADMSLSGPTATVAPAWGSRAAAAPIALLYFVPLLIAGLHFWWMRTAVGRARRREIAGARRALERVLVSEDAARDAAPRVLGALRALAAAAEQNGPGDQAAGGRSLGAVIERLETTAFDPSAGREPLAPDTVEAVRELMREWPGRRGSMGGGAGALLLALAAGAMALGAGAPATAVETGAAGQLAQARETYQAALGEADRVRRTHLFSQAERNFRMLAVEWPDAPELLVDWGNAALGAGDRGRAVLAWRRALAADPGHERAAKNLAWLRDRGPVWLPRPATGGALDSLLFWRERLSVGQRHWVGAGAFALGVLLLVPWSRRRAAALRRLAALPLVVWLVSTGSAMLSGDGGDAGVVLTGGTVLRSADSLGAPPAFGNPLPAGVEVAVLESRPGWKRVALADGTRGWLPASVMAAVRP